MWTLGERSGSKSQRRSRIVVNLSEYKGKTKIHFRRFIYSKKDDDERWFPTERGVALNLEEWETFLDNFEEINYHVQNIRGVNMWALGERSGSKSQLRSRIVVNLSEYEGKPKIHFRRFEYSKKHGERWFPTERGVALNLEEWETFLDNFAEIDYQIRRRSEQVTFWERLGDQVIGSKDVTANDLPKLRKKLISSYKSKVRELQELKKDAVHRAIMSKKRKLEIEEDHDSVAAFEEAIYQRKFMMFKAARLLVEDFEQEQEEESEEED